MWWKNRSESMGVARVDGKDQRGGCVCVCALSLSHVQLFSTPWMVAQQAPLSIGFPMQEYWSGLPFPSPGDLPEPGTEPTSPGSLALAGRFFTTEPPGKPREEDMKT